jgi:putative intracellular protease/amidase
MSDAYAAGRVIGGICHGPLGLLQARTPGGELVVRGRRVTAVTDRQVHQLGVAITPLHPETALRQAGALFEAKTHPARDFFANHFVADGDLITGQNQNSGPMVARLMMQRVLAKRVAEQRVAS